jgi:hypothetical protein
VISVVGSIGLAVLVLTLLRHVPTPSGTEDHGDVEPEGSVATGEDEDAGLVAPAES